MVMFPPNTNISICIYKGLEFVFKLLQSGWIFSFSVPFMIDNSNLRSFFGFVMISALFLCYTLNIPLGNYHLEAKRSKEKVSE